MQNKCTLDRRQFIKLGAAMAAGGTLISGQEALAARHRAIMATWGGDYSRLLSEIVAPVAQREADVEIVYDTGSTSARRTKVIAQAPRPRNSIDVVSFSDADMFLMSSKGFLEDISTENVPNSANILPRFKQAYAIPHIYSALVIVYNPDLVPVPASYRDLWKDVYAGKVGLANALYRNVILAAAVSHGGSVDNFEPGYDALLELKGQGVKVLPSNEAVANALNSGEIGVTLMWRARAFQWKNQGLPVAFAVPSEGAMPVVFEAAITRNASHPDAAAAVLNAMLDPSAQVSFAREMGYIPTVSNATLPEQIGREIGFTDAERGNFLKTNYEYTAAETPRMLEWWNQTFKG